MAAADRPSFFGKMIADVARRVGDGPSDPALKPADLSAPTPEKKARRGSETRARSQVMMIRLTDAERIEIEAAAKAASLDPGTYARHVALSEPAPGGDDAHVTTRPTRLRFRVTEAERAQIEDKANRAGLTTGSYIRARALKHPVTLTTPRAPIEKAEMARLLGLLGNVASNVNQIARQLNAGGEPELVPTRQALAAVETAAEQIIASMGRAPRPRVAR